MKRILSLCDYTGRWSEPYSKNGYEVIEVEILHGQDVRLLEHPGEVHGIIAQPPCTHFAGSGARWWKAKGEEKLLEGLQLVDACLRFVAICQPQFWVLENPVNALWLNLFTKHPAIERRWAPGTARRCRPRVGKQSACHQGAIGE